MDNNYEKWIWMPHAGHFICSYRCQFRLNTCVGNYIVSTVGEMTTDSKYYNASENQDWEEIGNNRKYETMVFRAKKSEYKCCPYEAIIDGEELDMEGYNDAGLAYLGHLRMCEKWSKE